jgi:hypothetical protein
LENYIGEKPQAPLTLQIYPGPDRSHQLYLDDGATREYMTAGSYRLVTVSTNTVPGAIAKSVRILRNRDNFLPPENFFFVCWRGVATAPGSVMIAGNPLAQAATVATLNASGSNGWFYDPVSATLTAKVLDTSPDVILYVA